MTLRKDQQDIREPTTRLKLAKILKDYKTDEVDYIRTSEAIEALIESELDKAREEEATEIFNRYLGDIRTVQRGDELWVKNSDVLEMLENRLVQLKDTDKKETK